MANQIIKKFIGDNQIDADKILLDNNTGLKSKDSMGALEKDLIKLDGSDKVVITDIKDPTSDFDAAHKKYVDDQVAGGGQALQDHINDASDAHDASAISVVPTGNLAASDVQAALQELQGDIDNMSASGVSYDNSVSMMSATNVQQGIDELDLRLDNLNASQVAFTAAGNISSVHVQTAIEELDTEKVAKAGDTMSGNLDMGQNELLNASKVQTKDALGNQLFTSDSFGTTAYYYTSPAQVEGGEFTVSQTNAGIAVYDLTISNGVSAGLSAAALSSVKQDGSGSVGTIFTTTSNAYTSSKMESYDVDGNSSLEVRGGSISMSSADIQMNGPVDMNSNNINGLPVPLINGQPLVFDQLGVGNGVTPLNVSGKIDSIYLPSYVDDVEEYANLAAFPVSGEASKIYVALDSNKTYRWSGSTYVEISPSEVNSVNGQFGIVSLDTDDISEGASNLYYTQSRFDSAFSGKNTDNLSEGSSNLYFTDARAKTAAVFDGITDGITDVAPSQNAVFDALALKFDSANFNSSFDSQLSSKDTDDLAEGTSNLYFTDARAKTAAVSNTAYGVSWNGVTDVAPSKNAVYVEMQFAKGRLDALEAVEWATPYKKTLIAGDITNGYIDLPHLAIQTNGMSVSVDRLALHQGASEDYTVSVVGGVTRITFLNDLVSPGSQALSIGDSIYVRYQKNA